MIFIPAHRPHLAKLDGEKNASITMARGRLVLVSAFFVLAYLFVGVRVADLSLVQGEFAHLFETAEQAQRSAAIAGDVRRGDILDRNGEVLATSLPMVSLFADPKLIHDKQNTARALAEIFKDESAADIYKNLNRSGRFVWLKRNILPEQQQAILRIGEPGLGFRDSDRRIYPQGALASHLLGFGNVDGYGLAGLEAGLQDQLSAGEDVRLSLDLRLQHVLRRELQKAIDDFEAIGGAGAIMDARTGEILAGVSLPDFDPHFAGEEQDVKRFNRLTLGVYELGSMFKIFSAAAVLDKGLGDFETEYDAREPIKAGRFTINDYHAEKRVLTLPEVFMVSSNIGSALMGRAVGGEGLRGFYSDLGLLSPMHGLKISEIARPLSPLRWGDIETMTAAYGHGVATTPLQLTSAVAAIVNGGAKVTPTLLRGGDEAPQNSTHEAVISPETSAKMRQLLRLVVTDGTGKNADVPGYMIGGKTGTAEKPGASGGYDRKKLISSFVGAFPIDDPKYVVMVAVDEPKGQKESYGYATAGWVAAPAVARIVRSMAAILGIPPREEAPRDYAADAREFVTAQEGG